MPTLITFPILCLILLANNVCLAQQPEPIKGATEQPTFTYVPLENKKEDLDLLQSYWPLKEDAFVADLHSLQARKWAIVVVEARGESESPKPTRRTERDEDNSTLAPSLQGAGILDNKDALDEIDFLRKYIEEDHKLTIADQEYYYRNVCMSHVSPVTNRSVCRFPEINIVDVLDSTQRQRLWKTFQKPALYPQYGDKAVPLGLKMLTGPVLGGVELDQATGEVRSVKSLSLRYFFRTQAPPDDIDRISTDWRNSLRDYVLNKHRPSSVIDFRYLDDEMMKMRLDAKNSNANLAARLLDPTPSSSSSGFWPGGLTAQLVFNRVTDLSRDAEVRAILKTLSAFENTPYTFGEDGTVCWLRSFLVWRKWLVEHLYGGAVQNEEPANGNENKNQDTTIVSSPSPFGTFQEDLRIFLQNPNYPVFSQHVVLTDVTGNGQRDLKAFRCLISFRNLTDQGQRTRAMQHLREIAAGNGRYNISVLGVDFFPPVPLSAPITTMQILLVPLGLGFVTSFMAYSYYF